MYIIRIDTPTAHVTNGSNGWMLGHTLKKSLIIYARTHINPVLAAGYLQCHSYSTYNTSIAICNWYPSEKWSRHRIRINIKRSYEKKAFKWVPIIRNIRECQGWQTMPYWMMFLHILIAHFYSLRHSRVYGHWIRPELNKIKEWVLSNAHLCTA